MSRSRWADGDGARPAWIDDPERVWPFLHCWVPHVTGLLAPSYGYGVDRLPRRGGFIVAANHFSAIDPPLLGAFSPRTIHFMAKAELLAMPGIGRALRAAGGFPVRRGGADTDAFRRAGDLVRSGRAVGMFAEGARQRLGFPGQAQRGIVALAMREDVPIVPCGLATFGWTPWNRKPCAVVWGEPLRLNGLAPARDARRTAVGQLTERVHHLWREAERAVADGYPESVDDGARRSAHVRRGGGCPAETIRPPAAARARDLARDP